MAHFGKDVDNFLATWSIRIMGSEQVETYTVYIIEITVGPYTWTVRHRYSDFHDLHEKLSSIQKINRNLLPPKKLFGNQSESFIKKRQTELEMYLQTVMINMAQRIPSALSAFLDFHRYEIHGITQALAEDLYNRGETILQTREVFTLSPLQLYSLTERLKLPEPTCDSGDVKKDIGHILDFITRLKVLRVCGTEEPVGSSNINMNKLKFDLTLFKSLECLELVSCAVKDIKGLETVKQTLTTLKVERSVSSMQEVLLQDAPHWKGEGGHLLVGYWDLVEAADFSHNAITHIHDSVQLLAHVETVDLSHNQVTGIQHLQWLSQLTHLNLAHNHLRQLEALHTKLGNLKTLNLANNNIQHLHGLSKLFSLETLDVSNNQISEIMEIKHVSRLPCLESLVVKGNPVTIVLDYRTRVLEMFGDRVNEVTLDLQPASQKELDTVAVLQALSKAKETKVRMLGNRKSSQASLAESEGSQPGSLASEEPRGPSPQPPSSGNQDS